MYFIRLYVSLCVIAGIYCLGPPAKSHTELEKCPQISGPSVLEYLDVENTGVERLVVYFYKATNSRHIIPFIPSREHQECIEDLKEGAGELLYNYNEISIEGLFNSQEISIRYRVQTTERIPETSLDIKPQAWDTPHILHGSHKHNNTDGNSAEEDKAVNSQEQDNSSPNNTAVIDDVDNDKTSDWHIPVQAPDDDEFPSQPSPSSSEHPDEKDLKEISLVGSLDEEIPQNSDISFIQPIALDENARPISGKHDKTPVIKPFENLSINPNHNDHGKPINDDEIGAPAIRPQENPTIDHNNDDILQPSTKDELDASPIKPLENPINGPNHHDISRPTIEIEIDASTIKPLEDLNIVPAHQDVLRPTIWDEINASPESPLENKIIRPYHTDLLNPNIEKETGLSPIIALGNPNIGPNHHDPLQPNIRDEINALPNRPQQNPIIKPFYTDLLHPIIGKETGALPIIPLENPHIGTNHYDQLQRNIRNEINASPYMSLNNPTIGPYHTDLLHPIKEYIDTSPIKPQENPIIGHYHHDRLHPIIIDEINPSPERFLENHINPYHRHPLQPFIPGEINASPVRPLENPIIGPYHHNLLGPIIRDEINPSPETYHKDLLHPIIEKETSASPIISPQNPYFGHNHHGQLQPVITALPERPLKNPSINPYYHNQFRPIIRDDISVSPEIVVQNPNRRPYYKDLLHPIIEEKNNASPIRSVENPIIEPDHLNQLWPITKNKIDPEKPLENPTTGPNHDDMITQPYNRDEIDVSPIKASENSDVETNQHDISSPPIEQEIYAVPMKPLNNLVIGSNDDKLRPTVSGENDTSPERSLENPIINPNSPEKLPSTGDKIEVNITDMEHHTNSGKDMNHRDFVSKKINGRLDINDESIKTLVLPNGDHVYSIEHGDSKETKTFHNVPSEDNAGNSDRLDILYEWHKVKVPRIDSNGKIYGWYWKKVKSPARSSSVKWSYWQSIGKNQRLTHWKHKSSSSKIYHHSSDDGISVTNFDGWVKNEIKKMQNNGNNMPSSDNDINTVKIAIEQTLKTNGIQVQSSGALIDSNGNVLRLDNIQLRPIYIGRSLAYNRILQNSDSSIKFRIPANTPFLEGLLVSLIKPARTLGIVPLGITALPRADSIEGIRKKLFGFGKDLHPISIQSGLRKLITGQLDKNPRLRSNETVKEDSKSEEEPEFRIIGGSFAVGSGTPLANRGRSGKD